MDFAPAAVADGTDFPEFWVQAKPFDGGAMQTANGVHFAFTATPAQQVQGFYRATLEHACTGDGEPGPREESTAAYYGCYVRDPDGHKIEEINWDESRTI